MHTQNQGLSQEMIKGSPNLLIVGPGRVWGPPTMQFGESGHIFLRPGLK